MKIIKKAIKEIEEYEATLQHPTSSYTGYQPTTCVITQPPNVRSSVQPNEITSLPSSVKTKFKPGDIVKIKTTSKSKYKEAIGIVEGYCCGHYKNICRVKLWRNKTIQIYDYNLETFAIKEN